MDSQLILLAKNVDLFGLVSCYTTIHRVASTNGGEYAGPCPKCGGKDRFRVQPNNAGGGIWFCRQCTGPKWQDAIAFQMFMTGADYLYAADTLVNGSLRKVRSTPHMSKVFSRKPEINKTTWQQSANDLINRSAHYLFSRDLHKHPEWEETDIFTGEKKTLKVSPLEYLQNRGLSRNTIQKWRIGYIPIDRWEDPRKWGLKGKNIFIPQGILIPCIIDGNVWYLKIRRPRNKPKYIQIRDSHPALFLVTSLNSVKPAIICEGELDSLLLWQHVSDMAGIISLGSMSNRIDLSIWWRFLKDIGQFYTAYDNDEAGIMGRQNINIPIDGHLQIPKLTRYSKDITDFHQAGGDIRAWIKKFIR